MPNRIEWDGDNTVFITDISEDIIYLFDIEKKYYNRWDKGRKRTRRNFNHLMELFHHLLAYLIYF